MILETYIEAMNQILFNLKEVPQNPMLNDFKKVVESILYLLEKEKS